MARKSAARRSRSRQDAEEGGGLLARVIDRTFENPATSGGLLVMALTATAIATNALFLQNGEHPGPLFTTRSEPGTAGAAASDLPPLPTRVIESPPLPHLAPRMSAAVALPSDPMPPMLPEPVVAPPQPVAPAMSDEAILVTEIQRQLARIGLYNETIDGMTGPKTEAAIRSFENAAGLAVTGQPSLELLSALKQPLPPTNTRSIALPDVDAEAQALDRRERERGELIAAEERRQAESRSRETYKVIQTALNRIGYGPLPIDGAYGADTAEAIRRFELDNGMAITGEASDGLVTRLIAIGAIRSG